jgi:hypothetical protein
VYACFAEFVVFVDVFDAYNRGGGSIAGCRLRYLVEGWHGFHGIVSGRITAAVHPESEILVLPT